VRGRARREAVRRRKSEWKVNLGIRNSPRSNGSWQMTSKTVRFSIVESRGIWTCISLQCTGTLRYNFIVCGPKFITSSGCEDTHTSFEVIVANTVNFRPNFKFSRSKVWGTPYPFWCALSKLGQSLARTKIWGREHPASRTASYSGLLITSPASPEVLI